MKDNKITYTDCIDVINEFETIEEIVMPNKYRRCCYNLLEFIEAIIQYCRMSDNFYLDKGSVSRNFCRCGRKAFHKETKTRPIRKEIQ